MSPEQLDEANNYSLILSILGMDEEGDPVAEVGRLKAELEASQAKLDEAEARVLLCGYDQEE